MPSQYNNQNAAIAHDRALELGILSSELIQGIPPETTHSRENLFERVDLGILKALDVIDFLTHALRQQEEINKLDPSDPRYIESVSNIAVNKPSRVEISAHIDTALMNAIQLKDRMERLLDEHRRGIQHNILAEVQVPTIRTPSIVEEQHKQLLERLRAEEEGGSGKIVMPSPTEIALNRPSQQQVADFLRTRVDKLNKLVGKAIKLVGKLDKMEKAQLHLIETRNHPHEIDELRYLMEFGSNRFNDEGFSKPESQSLFGSRDSALPMIQYKSLGELAREAELAEIRFLSSKTNGTLSVVPEPAYDHGHHDHHPVMSEEVLTGTTHDHDHNHHEHHPHHQPPLHETTDHHNLSRLTSSTTPSNAAEIAGINTTFQIPSRDPSVAQHLIPAVISHDAHLKHPVVNLSSSQPSTTRHIVDRLGSSTSPSRAAVIAGVKTPGPTADPSKSPSVPATNTAHHEHLSTSTPSTFETHPAEPHHHHHLSKGHSRTKNVHNHHPDHGYHSNAKEEHQHGRSTRSGYTDSDGGRSLENIGLFYWGEQEGNLSIWSHFNIMKQICTGEISILERPGHTAAVAVLFLLGTVVVGKIIKDTLDSHGGHHHHFFGRCRCRQCTLPPPEM